MVLLYIILFLQNIICIELHKQKIHSHMLPFYCWCAHYSAFAYYANENCTNRLSNYTNEMNSIFILFETLLSQCKKHLLITSSYYYTKRVTDFSVINFIICVII